MKNIKEIIIFISLLLIFIGIFALTIFSITSKDKVENNPNIGIYNNVLNDFENVYSSDIPKDSIYSTAYINPTSEIDLTNPKALYENADLVIVGTITNKEKGEMIEEYGYACIPGKLNVDTVLKGNVSNTNIEFFSNGGYCTVKEYIDLMSNTKKEKIEKIGLSALSNKEQEEKYLVFNYKYGKNFEEGKRYIIMLKEVNGKLISMSNYGFINITQEDTITSLSDILNIDKK